jgi:hypothetical protein
MWASLTAEPREALCTWSQADRCISGVRLVTSLAAAPTGLHHACRWTDGSRTEASKLSVADGSADVAPRKQTMDKETDKEKRDGSGGRARIWTAR